LKINININDLSLKNNYINHYSKNIPLNINDLSLKNRPKKLEVLLPKNQNNKNNINIYNTISNDRQPNISIKNNINNNSSHINTNENVRHYSKITKTQKLEPETYNSKENRTYKNTSKLKERSQTYENINDFSKKI